MSLWIRARQACTSKASLYFSGRIKNKGTDFVLKIHKILITDSPAPTNTANKLAPKKSKKVREISKDKESEDEGHTSTKQKKEVTKVLKSFDASPGFGVCLKKLLPKELRKYSDGVAGLLLFINERQHKWFARYHHREDLETNNKVMTEKWFVE